MFRELACAIFDHRFEAGPALWNKSAGRAAQIYICRRCRGRLELSARARDEREFADFVTSSRISGADLRSLP